MPRHDPDLTDPERLIPPAEFARILGHGDTTTLSHWLTNPPPGFPEPDEYVQLPTRRRALWRFRRARAFADIAPTKPGRRAGSHYTSAPNKNPRPDRDSRPAEVAEWLAQAAAGTREPVTRQEIEAHYGVPGYTARRVLARARHQPET